MTLSQFPKAPFSLYMSCRTFAFHSPNVTVPPAQLRTSWANRFPSADSCNVYQRNELPRVFRAAAHQWPSIDSNDEVKPGLDRQLEVRVPQNLEPKRPLFLLALLRRVAVEPRDEAIERVKHGR